MSSGGSRSALQRSIAGRLRGHSPKSVGPLPSYPINETTTTGPLGVQLLLAAKGQHRLPIPDLLIAAVAELNDLTVLHYDADYDRIAEVTGTAHRVGSAARDAVMPRPGSLPDVGGGSNLFEFSDLMFEEA